MKKRVSDCASKKEFRRFFTGIVLITVICISFGTFLVSAHEKESVNDITYMYYSIQIRPGDTLWTIAEDTMTDEYDSVAEYVQVLRDINDLDSDDIQAGRNLIILHSDPSDQP